MTAVARPIPPAVSGAAMSGAWSESIWAIALRSGRVVVGGSVLLMILLLCVGTLWWTVPGEPIPGTDSRMPGLFAAQDASAVRQPPSFSSPVALFGYDVLGRSILARCLLGGTISLAIGIAAATISVVLGVSVGLVAGYRGGLVDSALMRTVDVLYGLPYILLVILFKIGLEPQFVNGTWFTGLTVGLAVLTVLILVWLISSYLPETWMRWVLRLGGSFLVLMAIVLLRRFLGRWITETGPRVPLLPTAANLIVLFSAIGLVSWLTMARVVRGQVLSLRSQPFIEACRAMGLPHTRVFLRHILPNLVGPITVYATLTVPQAILQESFLSFLGVGVNAPLPTWGSLASEGVQSLSPIKIYWWMLIFPCILLVVTLLSLNFMGDGLRDVFDPKRESAKI